MSEKRTFYWIKLRDTFFSSDKVDFLMSQKDGANYIVLYQMLCLKCINNDGVLGRTIGEMIIPYDADKIVRDCKWFSKDTVLVALEFFKKLGLIYSEENGFYRLENFAEMVGSESSFKEQKRIVRANKDIKYSNCEKINAETIMLPTGEYKRVDEKRYGGNGMRAYALSDGKCENCGSNTGLLIHHNNGYSNDINDLYVLCTECHGKVHSNPPIELHHTRVKKELKGQVLGQVLPEIEIEKDIDKDINMCVNTERAIYTGGNKIPPTLQEVADYIINKELDVDASKFYNFYESKGWYVGKNKMKNWHSALANWKNNNNVYVNKKTIEKPNYLKRDNNQETLSEEELKEAEELAKKLLR